MTPSYKRPVGWFRESPQIRTHFNEADDRLLGESLKVRQLEPVVCLPDGTILCGARRVRGAKLVGMTELDAMVIEDRLSEKEFKRLQFTENMQRQDLTGFEQWQGCVELMNLNPNWSQKDLAAQLHIDPSMVIRLLSPSKCAEPVQEAFAMGQIGISDCYAISRLNEAEQGAALTMKLNGASRDALVSHIRQQRNGDKSSVKLARIRAMLPSGVVIVASGEGLSLDDLIDSLADARKEAVKARDQGLDAKVFQAVMKKKAMST